MNQVCMYCRHHFCAIFANTVVLHILSQMSVLFSHNENIHDVPTRSTRVSTQNSMSIELLYNSICSPGLTEYQTKIFAHSAIDKHLCYYTHDIQWPCASIICYLGISSVLCRTLHFDFLWKLMQFSCNL